MVLKLSLLLLLAVATPVAVGQRRRTSTATAATDEWNYRDGSEKVNMKNVANLTQVLDNWRFDILTQISGLLQNDHQSLLPDYARIQPLSEALDDLYKEFNALKSHLGDLTEKFVAIESFVDEIKTEKASNANSDAALASAPGLGPIRRRLIKKKAPAS